MYVIMLLQGCDVIIQFQVEGEVALHDLIFDDTRRYDTLSEAIWSLAHAPHLTAEGILAEIENGSPLEGDVDQFRARLRRERAGAAVSSPRADTAHGDGCSRLSVMTRLPTTVLGSGGPHE